MEPLIINSVTTTRSNAIVVYGDTNGFGSFARRNFEQIERVGDFSLKLFNVFFRYQAKTLGSLKVRGDGFLSVHMVGPKQEKEQANLILGETSRLLDSCLGIIDGFHAPRPDGFRIRVAAGHVGHFTMKLNAPSTCGNANCSRNEIDDWFGYPLVLGSRMLEMDRPAPLVCCSIVREWSGNDLFSFGHLPPERRIPTGIFAEDVCDLYTFKSKHD